MDKVEKRAARLFAEACILEGKIDEGLQVLRKCGIRRFKRTLVACGVQCLREGRLTEGLEAFREAGKDPPDDELRKCGIRRLELGAYHGAFSAFEFIRDPRPAIFPYWALRKCAKKCLERGDYQQAMDIYGELRVDPSR